jgi:hypothetical protein
MRTLAILVWAGALAAGQENDLSWVEARVAEWQMKPSERKFDQIGWLTDIRAGLALAKEKNRPLFLFTHDGRMAIGRC